MKDTIVELLNAGLTPAQVSEDLGCSETYVNKVIQEIRSDMYDE